MEIKPKSEDRIYEVILSISHNELLQLNLESADLASKLTVFKLISSLIRTTNNM